MFLCVRACVEWEGAQAQCLAHGVIIHRAVCKWNRLPQEVEFASLQVWEFHVVKEMQDQIIFIPSFPQSS